jgi:hypothetical protein
MCHYYDFTKHISTRKNKLNHKETVLSKMETEKSLEKSPNYFCEKCNYSTTILRDYKKHNNTKKHLYKVVNDDFI